MQVILKKDLLHSFLEDVSLLHGESIPPQHETPICAACMLACSESGCSFDGLHLLGAGLGVRLVIVLGSQQQIDAHLRDHGREPEFVGGYRVTDQAALKGAIEASGCSRMEVRAHAHHPSMQTDPAAAANHMHTGMRHMDCLVAPSGMGCAL